MESKRIGTFQEYLKECRKKKMLKENVNIECDWWDTAVVEVMQDLEKACNGYLDWEMLVKYIKSKYAVLGRELPGYDDLILIEHIKDLIFQYHGDAVIVGDNTQLHSQGVVIQELAQEILDKVRAKTCPDAQAKNAAKVKLCDREPAVMVPMKEVPVQDVEDDAVDCLQYECRNVKTLDEYTKLLKEQVQEMKCEYYDSAVADCLAAIKKDAGSLKYDAVVQAAAWADEEDLLHYVQGKVLQVVEKISKEGKLSAKGIDKKNARATKTFLNQAIGMLCNDITADVLKIINKETGRDEKVE